MEQPRESRQSATSSWRIEPFLSASINQKSNNKSQKQKKQQNNNIINSKWKRFSSSSDSFAVLCDSCKFSLENLKQNK